MSGISKKYMDFLSSESEYWQEQGIITGEQSEKILSLYEVRQNSLNKILFIAGGIMLCLGLVSFALAHWHELPKLLRVCMIAGGYLASLAVYGITGRSETRTGRAFLLVSSLFFGAGIYLITRMYDYKLDFADVLGWWLVQLLITVMCTRDVWQLYFSQAVSLIYLNWINAVDLFALELMGTAKVALTQFFMPVQGFVLLAALWLTRLRVKDRTAFNVNMLLTLLVVASRMSLCFGGTWTLIILAIAGAAISFSRLNDAEIIGLLVAGLCGLILTWPETWRGSLAENGSVFAIVSAVLTAIIMLVNIWRGHSITGIIFCAILVIRYFFDHLFGYMSKAWGFGIVGVLFVVAGIYTGIKNSPQEIQDTDNNE